MHRMTWKIRDDLLLARVDQIREKRGLSRQTACESIGIGNNRLWYYNRGWSGMNMRTFLKIVNWLGARPEEFFEEE